MGQADEEPSAGSQELPFDIKQLIATFGAVIYKDWMPSKDEIEEFGDSPPIKIKVTVKQCQYDLHTKINPTNPNPIPDPDQPSTSGIPNPLIQKRELETSSEASTVHSVSSSASTSAGVQNS